MDIPLLIQNFETSKANPGYRMKAVILGACHSANIADQLKHHVEFCVGFTGAVHDEVVRIFTRGFFANLSPQYSIEGSVLTAKQILANDSTYGASVSQLKYFGKDAPSTSARLPGGAGVRV